ncbi:MAG: RNA methyltransferase [Clostridia bacterium]|nr:RNA methyltransferase [Clostridia bacterium]
MKRIESRNNPTIKNVCLLSDRSERSRQGLFFFEGVHLLEEFIRSGKRPRAVFIREDASPSVFALAEGSGAEVYGVTESVYAKMSSERAPQGVLTVVPFLDNVITLEDGLPEGCFSDTNSVILDRLQDPGNVGTVVRTAAALGANVILASCADIYSPKTVRATMGAMFHTGIFVTGDAAGTVKKLRASGIRVIAASVYGENVALGKFEILKNDCFVIGNEGAGISEEILAECDLSARIPMTGSAESLNAASAAAMFLWEARRNVL